MTVRIYRSTDASAPTLSGSNGALITVLDAVLVNGYGLLAAAGWTKPFSGTNKAVYRMATSGNTGFYLNVNDAGPGGGGAREARVTGFQAMTAQDVGTGPFPHYSQLGVIATVSSGPADTGGVLVVRKSNTADATARAWTIVANGSAFYLFVETGDFTQPTMSYPFAFGDFFTYGGSDTWNCMMIGRNAENTNAVANDGFAHGNPYGGNVFGAKVLGHYVARHWTGVGGSVFVGKHWDCYRTGMNGLQGGQTSIVADNTNYAGGGVGQWIGGNDNFPSGNTFPGAADHRAIHLSPLWIHHHNSVRGYYKGLWAPGHNGRSFAHGETFSGVGRYAGKSFIVMHIPAISNGGTRWGLVVVETSDTWS